MRKKTDSKENCSFGVTPMVPWRICSMMPLDNYCLSVQFMDGLSGVVDLSGLILEQNAGVFSVLRDIHLFKQVYIDRGAVAWPGNLDLAPDAMYDAIQKNGKCIL